MTPSYATRADCLAYTEGLVVDDNAAFDRLIERCEAQIDQLLATVPWPSGGGRKYAGTVLTGLPTNQREALRRATCAQVEYRNEMGEAFFIRPQFSTVKGPDFETEGERPEIGPKVWGELAGAGLLVLATHTGDAGDGNPPWYGFAYHDPSEP